MIAIFEACHTWQASDDDSLNNEVNFFFRNFGKELETHKVDLKI